MELAIFLVVIAIARFIYLGITATKNGTRRKDQ